MALILSCGINRFFCKIQGYQGGWEEFLCIIWHILLLVFLFWGFPSSLAVNNPTAMQEMRHRRYWFDPWVGKIPWRKAWQHTPIFLPGRIPCTEETSRLYSIGSERVGQDWSDWAHTQVFVFSIYLKRSFSLI